ncbi:MAG: ABC transporter permease [Patescibacteria group bacterium]|nr:ABC transporter permease [Patescibacteria group bacterium]MDD4304561.1 ABC transporter permease [Patescibacteria group bacterium]MDD4695748.1 ABC transporter permease [Patescibacteria group bacterium]
MFELVKQSAKISIMSLLANKARSFLTMLGIIIGVSAVIVITSIGNGAQDLILSQIKSLGTDSISIMPGKSEKNGPPASVMGIVITTLTYEDAKALLEKKNSQNIISVAAYSNGSVNVGWKSNSINTDISGTNVDHLYVSDAEMEFGRFFTESEETNLAKVAVLGSQIKKDLFGNSEAIGQKIKIKKQVFEVIGIMKEKGNVGFQSFDGRVFVPIKTMQKLILGVNHVGIIRAKVDYEKNVPLAIIDAEKTLRERHSIKDSSGENDDFSVRSAAEAMDIVTTITNALKFFLAAMAAISLVVGGIGIMNIMLVNVSERTNELGLRKALGANNKNILTQFLIESTFLTLIGGTIGIIFGILVSFLISVIMNLLKYNWGFHISAYSIIMGLVVSTSIGLIFGIYPAKKASKLNPIEALRYE